MSYGGNQVSRHDRLYPTSVSPFADSRSHYRNADAMNLSDSYYVGIAPTANSTMPRYLTAGQGHYFCPSTSTPEINSSAYPTHDTSVDTSYPQPEPPLQHSQTHFIPTPSEIYSSYPPRQISVPPRSPSQAPYSIQYPPLDASLKDAKQHPGRISAGHPQTVASAASITSPTGERFLCERCGKTFSRSHDRKRHYETQHLASPVIHRCRYCEKEFSRADSLKRHLDNGCDEMPDPDSRP